MAYLGSWKIDDYITIPAHTTRFSSGAAYDATSITFRVYEDVTNTEIVSDTAMTKFDTETGFYLNQLQLTAAAGFEKGKAYTVLIKATVDGVAGTASHTFQIEAEVDANVVSDKTGYALSGTQTFNVTGDITGNLSGSVGSVTGAVGSVTGNVGGNVAGSVASVTAGVTVTTNNDKTGYTLTSGPLDAAGVRTAIGLATANLDAQLAAIVADTGELQTDWANGGRLDLLIDGLIADLVKVKAAVYDTASVTGSVITLSNGATQTIGADGDRTTA